MSDLNHAATAALAALALAGAAGLGGCSLSLRGAATARSGGAFSPHWSIARGADGGEVTFSELVDAAAKAPVVYLAERHDQPADHAVQVAVATALAERGASLVVGVEMVEETAQGTLDAHCAGSAPLDALAQALDWKRTWGFDFAAYAPLFELCRSHRAILVALSPPLARVRVLARDGKVEGSTPLDTGFEDHRAYVLEALGAHGSHHRLDPERFYRAQLYRDERMAERMASALAKARAAGAVPLIGLVVAGRGHLEYGFGIPARLDPALPRPGLVVLPASDDEGMELRAGRRRADYFVRVGSSVEEGS